MFENFDPASLVVVEAINPKKVAAPRVAKNKPRFQAFVTEKGIRFAISTELAGALELAVGQNGINVLTDPNNPSVVALAIVPEEGAQLLSNLTSNGEPVTRKSRNFQAHAIAAPLTSQGLIGTALGTYNFDLQKVENTPNIYVIVIDEREGISHELESVADQVPSSDTLDNIGLDADADAAENKEEGDMVAGNHDTLASTLQTEAAH